MLSVEQLRQKLQMAGNAVHAGAKLLHRQTRVLALKQDEIAELKQAARPAAADAPAPRSKHPNQPQQAKPARAGLGLSPEELSEEVQRLTVSIQGMQAQISRCQPTLQAEEAFCLSGPPRWVAQSCACSQQRPSASNQFLGTAACYSRQQSLPGEHCQLAIHSSRACLC